jgi:transcription antitermination factor NusA-like protein
MAVKVCFCIPVDAVQLIVGKSGESIKKVSAESEAFVCLQSADSQPGSNERIMVIEGARDNIVIALKAIIAIVVGRKSTQLDSLSLSVASESVVELLWLIPQQHCGILIGKGGECVNKIAFLSGAHVRVLHIYECMETPGERFELFCLNATHYVNAGKSVSEERN